MFDDAHSAGKAQARANVVLRASACRIIVATMALAVGSGVAAQPQSGACVVTHARGENGATITAQMSVVNDGTPCVMHMRLGGHPATSLTIRSRPASGTLAVADGSVSYVPRAGFAGKDSFDVQWFGVGFGPNSKSRNLRTTVDVTVRAASDEPDAMGAEPETTTSEPGK